MPINLFLIDFHGTATWNLTVQVAYNQINAHCYILVGRRIFTNTSTSEGTTRRKQKKTKARLFNDKNWHEKCIILASSSSVC